MTKTRKNAFLAMFLGWAMFILVATSAIATTPNYSTQHTEKESLQKKSSEITHKQLGERVK